MSVYQPGQRLLLRTPIFYKKPQWHTVKTLPNKEGILLLEADSGVISGLTAQQIKRYEQEAKSELSSH